MKLDTDLTGDDLRGLVHRVQAALPRGRRRRLPAGPARAAAARDRRRVPLLGRAAGAGLPPGQRHLRRPRHGREHLPDGVRQPRRRLGHRRLLLARPVHRRARLYGEFLRNAQGEDVVAGIRTPEPIERMRELLPEAYDELVDDRGAARAALPRRAGHRVHGRAGPPLPAADAHRQAHGAGRAAHRARPRRRGRDHAGRGRPADRPAPARPAAASRGSTVRAGRADRARAERLAGRGGRRGRLRRRHRASARGAPARR